jgi:hypothetical protein
LIIDLFFFLFFFFLILILILIFFLFVCAEGDPQVWIPKPGRQRGGRVQVQDLEQGRGGHLRRGGGGHGGAGFGPPTHEPKEVSQNKVSIVLHVVGNWNGHAF